MKKDIFTPVIGCLEGSSDSGVSQIRVSGGYSAGCCAAAAAIWSDCRQPFTKFLSDQIRVVGSGRSTA
jgi:hypothetical protein